MEYQYGNSRWLCYKVSRTCSASNVKHLLVVTDGFSLELIVLQTLITYLDIIVDGSQVQLSALRKSKHVMPVRISSQSSVKDLNLTLCPWLHFAVHH